MTLRKNILKYSAFTAGALAVGVAATQVKAHADEIYTVKSGDTLSQIALDNTKSTDAVDTIAKNNNIADVNVIYVGQQLLITSDGQIKQATDSDVASTPAAASSSSDNSASASSASSSASSTASSSTSSSEAAAKAWIVQRESGGNYSAQNGQYYGAYQLSSSYLGGDYSAAHQDAVADQYVASRYGSWTAAQAFWQANGWY